MAEQGNFNSTQSAPKVGDDDLYAQIAAGDQEEEAPHTRSSLTMNLMVSYMRWMLLIDAKRRQYQKVFRIFDGIWAILMTILYLMGLVMLLILIISYLRFPTEIQRYLNVNGIICDQMEIPTYANSRVNLKGLHDKDNTYRIDSLSISSTFSDFLNHRARNVSVKGVKITFDPNNEKVNNLIMTLARLNQRGANSGGLQIDSLEVSDATVTFKGK
ncbi:MAG: hypothetical protein SPL08_01725, partial [Pseudomonadota bacterium]|nr:hypothetical protein [Pseudomonadota bacterium]